MKLFDAKTVRMIMHFTPEEIDAALKAGNWGIGDEWKEYNADEQEEKPYFYTPDILPRAITYAQTRYPGKARETGIFAAMVEGFTTGMFGGFGQDQDPLYEKAEEAITALAGGVPASINDPEDKTFGIAPPLDDSGNLENLLSREEFTRAGIQLLENICFRTQQTALEEALKYITESLALQEKSRQAFKSKTIDRSRDLATSAKKILEKLLK